MRSRLAPGVAGDGFPDGESAGDCEEIHVGVHILGHYVHDLDEGIQFTVSEAVGDTGHCGKGGVFQTGGF